MTNTLKEIQDKKTELRIKNKVYRGGRWVTQQSQNSMANFIGCTTEDKGAENYPFRKMYHNVDIYRNLNRDCWSIKDRETGRICGYETSLMVMSAKFIVGKKSRQRVLEEGRKNVHAYVRSGIAWADPTANDYHSKWLKEIMLQVKYDPYKADHFFIDEDHMIMNDDHIRNISKDELHAIYTAQKVYLRSDMTVHIPERTSTSYLFYKELPLERR